MQGIAKRVTRALAGLLGGFLLVGMELPSPGALTASAPRAHVADSFHASGAAPPCLPGGHPSLGAAFCYSPDHFRQAARGLPFAAADPRGIVGRFTHLSGVVTVVQRVAYPPIHAAAFPLGPPQSIETYFGSSRSTWNLAGPPKSVATFVLVVQYPLSQTGKPRLRQVEAGGQWIFTADIPRQRMTIEVNSDGPKRVVAAIGSVLVTAEKHLPARRIAPERVYVAAPHVLHGGVPATFWVLVAPRWGTYPAPAFDFDFTLGGAWGRPVTETPDGSQACGGDNVAGEPTRRHGRWVFHWGDCPELGLILTPHGTGIHRLTIYGYSVPLTSQGMLDRKHEKLAAGSGYRWRGKVLP